MPCWIDTHCHLDAPEFAADADAVRAQARAAGVPLLVLPAVQRSHWPGVRRLALHHGDGYALGIHPLATAHAGEGDLHALEQALAQAQHDPHLVAVGEIGLDFFVPGLDVARQWHFYRAQLRLAQRFGLPVLLHVRKSVDAIHKGLREVPVAGGIAHAFNGSTQQAERLVGLGMALGFGGAATFTRARNIRRLVADVPAEAIVLETDAPDIAPAWAAPGRNSPAELPQIAAELAALRGMTVTAFAALADANARRVLRLG